MAVRSSWTASEPAPTLCRRLESKGHRSKYARHPRAAALLFALAAGVHASRAAADATSGIEIEWDAPAECPDAKAIRSATERLLGESLDAPRSQHIAARARVRHNASGHWEIAFSLSSNGSVSEETFAAERCTSLADAVALKVALAADPLAYAKAAIPAKRAPDVPRAAPDAAPEPPVSARNPSEGRAWRVAIRAAGGAGLGLLPRTTPGGALVGAILFRSFRIELGAQIFADSQVAYADMPSVGASFDMLTGTARTCAVAIAIPVEVPICAGLEFGALGAKGFGVEPAYHPYRSWAALLAGPALRLPLKGNLSLWLEFDGVLLLLRPSFRIRDFHDLYEAPAGGARGWAGLEFALP